MYTGKTDKRRQRGLVPCYWEKQPGGCLKVHCAFHHSKPRSINELHLPASREILCDALKRKSVFERLGKRTSPPRVDAETAAVDDFVSFMRAASGNLSHLPKRKGPENGRATKPKQLSKAVEGFLSWIRTPSDGSIELAQQTCVEWLWEWERKGSKTGAVLPADRARDTEEAAHSSGDEKTQADCRETETLCSQNPSPENAVGRSKRVLKRKLPFAEYGESTGEPPLKVRVRNDYTIVPSDSSARNPPCTSEEEPEARKEPSSRKRRMTEALDNEPPKKRRILDSMACSYYECYCWNL
ncbi:uncharacterized protein LOC131701786 [Acipenser ruthenus]|uniref:uncharacterized protein LOC131701786 n=1 Tax=Acipenser ruthenus TaxID=7906 RepID=UPI0027405095|nr:uncharacterized protein LOC131701786 [Acipenser ruthenus]